LPEATVTTLDTTGSTQLAKQLATRPLIRLFAEPDAHSGRRLLLFILLAGVGYGAAMGWYSLAHDRPMQIVLSAVKVPMLLLGTFALSLPSFFVMNTLLGTRDDFRDALRAHLQAQAALTIILLSLAPLTLTWYAGNDVYSQAILFNAVMFGLASLSAQMVLRRLYEPLIRRNANHRLLLRAWLVLYAFVGIQLGWVLRPFIGRPGSPVRFFREGAWGNAYIELWKHLQGAF
jgi:hypothetical protein